MVTASPIVIYSWSIILFAYSEIGIGLNCVLRTAMMTWWLIFMALLSNSKNYLSRLGLARKSDRSVVSSSDRFREACSRIPGGCSTSAKSPLRNPAWGPYFATRAHGGHFTDDEGREWLDFDMALSAAVIGYAVPAIDEAVIRQIKKGFVFSVPSLLEAELAERLCERFPSVECVRFCKDGSDATSAAVRIARRVTGRSKIVIGSFMVGMIGPLSTITAHRERAFKDSVFCGVLQARRFGFQEKRLLTLRP